MSSENDLNVTKTRGRRNKYITRNCVESVSLEEAPMPTEQAKTPLKAIKNLESIATPSRRSMRKSVRPPQDYDEIILNKSTLSAHNTEKEASQLEEQKWTPAKVGRVSQKRSTRKGRSAKKLKVTMSTETSDDSEGKDEVLIDNNKKAEEAKEVVHNATFEKGNGDNLVEDCPKKVTEDKQVILVEIGIFSTDEEDQVGLVPNGKSSACVDDKSKARQSYDGEIEVSTQLKDAPMIAEKSNEEILNTTFNKENEENSVEGTVAMDAPMIAEKSNGDSVEGTVAKSTEGQKVENTEEGEVEKSISKILNESFDLGCTPILDDDNEAAKQENVLEVDLGCTPLSNNDTFEKATSSVDNDIDDAVFEEPTKDATFEKTESIEKDATFEKTESIEYPHGETEKVKNITQKNNDPLDQASEDEMICLILSDDEDSDANKDAVKDSFNDTFNMSDCVIISPTEPSVPEMGTQQVQNAADEMIKQMPENYASPVLKKKTMPEVVLTNEENVAKVLLSTPRFNRKHPIGVETPISANERQLAGTLTPKLKQQGSTNKATKAASKGYRFPTPYKVKKDFNFADKENATLSGVSLPQVEPILTTLEPKEIVLRSIRKRSLSVTIDGDQRKRRALNVTFCSPANQTTSIADLDEKLAKSAAKNAKAQNLNKNVTQRKRSISFDENYLRSQPSKLPRPVLISPHKQRKATRTKLPNFAAIHQQQFQKMENLVDYVARKAERAQNLTNSAIKSQKAAAASPAMKKQQSIASKSLILTTSNKNTSNAGKPMVLTPNKTPNKKNLSVVADNNKNISEMLNNRAKRHIDMFKACPADSKRVTRKNNDIIRGVRSNRRFELMMQHRKTSGN